MANRNGLLEVLDLDCLLLRRSLHPSGDVDCANFISQRPQVLRHLFGCVALKHAGLNTILPRHLHIPIDANDVVNVAAQHRLTSPRLSQRLQAEATSIRIVRHDCLRGCCACGCCFHLRLVTSDTELGWWPENPVHTNPSARESKRSEARTSEFRRNLGYWHDWCSERA